MIAQGAHPARAWRPRRPETSRPAGDLEGLLGLPRIVADFLRGRGLGAEDAARRYLRPRVEHLGPPHGLADLPAAVARLETALRSGETIFIHGDYDVDGMCGAALYARVLRRLGGAVVAHVPHRLRDGYDLGPAGIERARAAGARLLLTVDCGTTARDAVATAGAAGMDVIVTDHHAVGGRLPDCLAVVNPAREDCAYGEPLCGTGVAFKVCEALVAARGGSRQDLLWELDLVALATIADLVPLRGENRVLARYGIRVLANSRNPGLRELLRECGADVSALRTRDLSHGLAPRLNAIGRLEDAADGLALLLEGDPGSAAVAARHLGEVNRRRQELDRATLEEALSDLAAVYDPARGRSVVVAGHGWHPGVIGIVASRLVERLHRPTFVIALPDGDGIARGSGRSIPGFDLVGALADTSPLLARYGGHAMAAGLDIAPERVADFRRAFEVAAVRRLTPDQLTPAIAFDAEASLATLLDDFAPFQRNMEPFGVGNPTPTFLCRDVRVAATPRVVGRGHLKLRLERDDRTADAIGFHLAEGWESLETGSRLDVVVQLREEVWRRRRSVVLKLLDARPVGTAEAPTSATGAPGPGRRTEAPAAGP